jgi:hypothetical protein
MRGVVAALGLGLALCGGFADTVSAQSNTCQQLAPIMQERERLVQRINGMGRRNIDPRNACTLFGQLVSNGQKAIAFVDANKDWCQIPDEFAENLRRGQQQATSVRAQACRAANQQAQAIQQQRRQAERQQQEQGAFGGVDGFSGGPWRVPQGAL